MKTINWDLILSGLRLGLFVGSVAVGCLMALTVYLAMLLLIWHLVMIPRKVQKKLDTATKNCPDDIKYDLL